MIVTLVVVLTSVAVLGFWAQRRLHAGRFHDDPVADVEGLPVKELVIPLRTLATLLLAFVLVSVFQSYQRADDEAAAESAAVLSMAETAVLLTPTARQDVLGQLTCYARSVSGPDWRSQTDGRGPSPVTDAAGDAVVVSLRRATAEADNEAVLGSLLSDNSLRIQTRTQRIEEARPSVPGVVWAVLAITVAAAVGGLAAFGHPGVRRRMQLLILAGTTLGFAMTLAVIHDLDRPYGGLARIEPTSMLNTERRIAALSNEDVAPCAGDGTPRG